jgi:hypothetical protein
LHTLSDKDHFWRQVKHPINMISLKKSIQTAAIMCCLICSLSAFAQSQSLNPQQIFYVKIESLNVENHRDLRLYLRQAGVFVVESSCVPAKILAIKYTGSNSTSVEALFNQFKQEATHAQITSMLLLNTYTEASFNQACADTRGSN